MIDKGKSDVRPKRTSNNRKMKEKVGYIFGFKLDDGLRKAIG
jgi:hypothetical protein